MCLWEYTSCASKNAPHVYSRMHIVCTSECTPCLFKNAHRVYLRMHTMCIQECTSCVPQNAHHVYSRMHTMCLRCNAYMSGKKKFIYDNVLSHYVCTLCVSENAHHVYSRFSTCVYDSVLAEPGSVCMCVRECCVCVRTIYGTCIWCAGWVCVCALQCVGWMYPLWFNTEHVLSAQFPISQNIKYVFGV